MESYTCVQIYVVILWVPVITTQRS
jgi:hypothetical protein